MNEHLEERFNRSKRDESRRWNKRFEKEKHLSGTAEIWLLPPKLNDRIQKYYSAKPENGGHWLSRPEIPSSTEILDEDGASSVSGDVVEISPNRPKGAFADVETYLSTHYELLREDAVRPLREAVSKVRFTPTATEDAFQSQIGIYEKVHICAVFSSTRGVAIRVSFSLRRAGKQILWEQSKRLISGTLVVLTPSTDMFQTQAIVATVGARPLTGLQQNPPQIDLFFAAAEELQIDPSIEYVMVEERRSFYEAVKHTLLGLQHMMGESFPLKEHIVCADKEIGVPHYILRDPHMDFSPLIAKSKQESYSNVNVLKNYPRHAFHHMDTSQIAALEWILTKRLAMIQGPPGTGKTFVTVEAVKIMCNKWSEGDPPIVIACQTNHAVDQMLRHIAKFEPSYVRLGGRSKDQDVVKKRTMHEVRKMSSENPPAGCAAIMARKRMNDMQKDIALLLTPLRPDKRPMDHRVLQNFELLSKEQADSLELGASKWVQDTLSNPNAARSPFTVWLGEKLIPVPINQQAEYFGFEFEEADLEFEQLKELEAENIAKDDDFFDTLSGQCFPVADNFTCRPVSSATDDSMEKLLKENDMWRIPEASRSSLYCFLQAKLKDKILTAFRKKAAQYNQQALQRRIGYWEMDENILKRQKIIGMTTTGLSKYRALVNALQPSIMFIEEAAETLEAPIAVGCLPSLQHLVLVGDHQQLRPHTQVRAHEDRPYFLNVSLFERLINNKLPFQMLVQQRRMIPEIRRVLYPIYKNKIKDHPSVINLENRPPVPGMGGLNSYFFTHQWREQRDDQMSCYNRREADMVVGLVEHLNYNGVDLNDITLLTFYNGQRKCLLTTLRGRLPTAKKFNVVTVDSYQGEENKIVILSLVRSNESKQIGFLSAGNRVCVALSRAMCGFYIFGNGMLLHEISKTWQAVIAILAGQKIPEERPAVKPNRLGQRLPVQCVNHNRTVQIEEPEDWNNFSGGCDIKCGGRLPCGHACELLCHPMSHESLNCSSCSKTTLSVALQTMSIGTQALQPKPNTGSDSAGTGSTESWKSYSEHEQKRVSAQQEAMKGRLAQRKEQADLIPVYDNSLAKLDHFPDQYKDLKDGENAQERMKKSLIDHFSNEGSLI